MGATGGQLAAEAHHYELGEEAAHGTVSVYLCDYGAEWEVEDAADRGG